MATVSHAESTKEDSDEAEESRQKENGPHGFKPASRFDCGEDYRTIALQGQSKRLQLSLVAR